jgi:hypothetical protein
MSLLGEVTLADQVGGVPIVEVGELFGRRASSSGASLVAASVRAS